MASSNKTEKLKLNSWAASDKPQRNDFNSDNLIIDQVLGGHVDDSNIHLTSTEKARVSRPIQLVAYMGDGKESILLNLSYIPTAVIVYREDMPPAVYDSTEGCTKVYSALAVYGGGATSGVKLSGAGVTAYQSASKQNGVKFCMNELNAQYKVAVIR